MEPDDALTEDQQRQVQEALSSLRLEGELGRLFEMAPDIDHLAIRLSVEDNRRPGEPMTRRLFVPYIRLGWLRALQLSCRYDLSIAQVWQAWARAWLGGLLLHEMDEQLHLGPERFCDPHAGLPERHAGAGLEDAVEHLFRAGLRRLSFLANAPEGDEAA